MKSDEWLKLADLGMEWVMKCPDRRSIQLTWNSDEHAPRLFVWEGSPVMYGTTVYADCTMVPDLVEVKVEEAREQLARALAGAQPCEHV